MRQLNASLALIVAAAATTVALRSQPPAPPVFHTSISHYDDAKLSQPRYQVLVEANVRVPMRDGVTLSTDIFRPDAPGKFAALLIRTPYSKATAVSVPQARRFAERGYAVVQ